MITGWPGPTALEPSRIETDILVTIEAISGGSAPRLLVTQNP